jgi:hypothetical protein
MVPVSPFGEILFPPIAIIAVGIDIYSFCRNA